MLHPVKAFMSLKDDLTRNPILDHFQLSAPTLILVKGLTIVHWMWWFRRKKELLKAENIIPGAIGAFADVAIKIAPAPVEQTIRGIAKVLLIATRIDECFQSMKQLSQAFNQLTVACRADYAPFIEPQWIKNPESLVFSLHTLNSWNQRGKNLIVYLRRIYYCLLHVFVKTFEVSMHMWDIYHAFLYSHDDMPEVCINGMYWLRKLEKNQEHFNQQLEKYEPLIQKFFNSMGNGWSARKLTLKAKSVLNGTARFVRAADKAGDALVDTGKKVVHVIRVKSNLLVQGLSKNKRVHTPFVLRKMPPIEWPHHPSFRLGS